ncbi:MAG: AAA family ATPase [Anaerolineales bacterium]|nr:AAA family ATPase [Anaerolineales bacterium]
MKAMSEREQLEQAINTLEAQRAILGDAVVDTMIAAARKELAALERTEASRLALEGERKLVTVMFADISGFTALAETMDPESVRDLMNTCFEQLVPVIQKYEGTVDKFIGDGVMALFGAPLAHENDPARALQAALEMMDALAAFNAQHRTDLEIHFGVNTGLVIAGGIGTRERQEYSVMGDAVNLAARLEDASGRGEILVGPDTYRLTAPLFDFEALPPLRVKGRSELVVVYRLLGLRAAPSSVRGIEGLFSPLVGRGGELLQLQTALRVLQEGRGGKVAIIGEAGLGKSRLVAEARQSLNGSVAWVEGRCLAHTQGMGYWVARDVLYGLLGVNADTPVATVGEALYHSVAQLLPEHEAELYPYLALELGVPLDAAMTERVKYLEAATLQRRMHEAFREYVRRQAMEQPLVLVWEDLHWADPSSLHLLEALLSLTDEMPLLLLLALRLDGGRVEPFHLRATTTFGQQYQVIELEPLTHDDGMQLVHNLLKIENLPEEPRELILDRAGGNPFYIEELLRSLIDAGVVILRGERAIATHAISELDVPDTLQGVIMARIDRLIPRVKRTLQTASVIGRVFQRRVLACLLDPETANGRLDATLEDLRGHEFIHVRAAETWDGVEEQEYTFKHALTQETAYHSLLITQCQ